MTVSFLGSDIVCLSQAPARDQSPWPGAEGVTPTIGSGAGQRGQSHSKGAGTGVVTGDKLSPRAMRLCARCVKRARCPRLERGGAGGKPSPAGPVATRGTLLGSQWDILIARELWIIIYGNGSKKIKKTSRRSYFWSVVLCLERSQLLWAPAMAVLFLCLPHSCVGESTSVGPKHRGEHPSLATYQLCDFWDCYCTSQGPCFSYL